MKITFLGTGTSQGIPVIGSNHPVSLSKNKKDSRLRTSAMISWENINLVIDCGPDFRQQMLTNKVSHLEAILFTHEHADHTTGLDDIRPFVYQQGDMPIYALPRVISELKRRFEYIFRTENRYLGAPSVIINEIDDESFSLFGKTITPIQVMHGNLPILGYRIQNMAYITDAKTIRQDELDKLHDLDVLVLNCLREQVHPTHLNLEEALEIIEIVKPKRTFFTHISQTFGFHDEVSEKLPPNVFLAYDNLVIDVK
ncbi:MBL fold metallo-hydrolase [Capnocytophaga felis]|uniref:MBL fold metallo-hydrolase n=1 Tax=Capnocytophaga felis TaxID=2267611 RepID=A0A5M4B699_9FLAO|nr:MBL fold metallo-hydrolase [Capnocytophaga felis]GET44850.1 MBL fold metallo-hydrolase [Capnocytophaga felis]GET48623.1 MBL fold metallo-hydrolase [Capnocytophaga felis]